MSTDTGEGCASGLSAATVPAPMLHARTSIQRATGTCVCTNFPLARRSIGLRRGLRRREERMSTYGRITPRKEHTQLAVGRLHAVVAAAVAYGVALERHGSPRAALHHARIVAEELRLAKGARR